MSFETVTDNQPTVVIDVPTRPPDIVESPKNARPGRPKGKVKYTKNRESWVISDETKFALERCELFQDIDRSKLMQVAALVVERTAAPDELLIEEGAPADNIVIIVEGHAIAQLKLDHGWISLGLTGPGEIAGWSALVGGQIYPASVKALTPMRVGFIETSGLSLLMNIEPAIGYPVHKRLSSIFYRQYQSALSAIKTSV